MLAPDRGQSDFHVNCTPRGEHGAGTEQMSLVSTNSCGFHRLVQIIGYTTPLSHWGQARIYFFGWIGKESIYEHVHSRMALTIKVHERHEAAAGLMTESGAISGILRAWQQTDIQREN